MTREEALCKALDMVYGAPITEPVVGPAAVNRIQTRAEQQLSIENQIVALRPCADEAWEILAAVEEALFRRYNEDEDVRYAFISLAAALETLGNRP